MREEFQGGIYLDTMQEEAMRRVREMQTGRAAASHSQPRKNSREKPESEALSQAEEKPRNAEPSVQENLNMSPFDGLFKDKEKLLILLLIMLLSQEGTNTELVLALLYIII